MEGSKARHRTLSLFSVFMAVMLFVSYLFVTAPYGMTEDGQKVETPYVIKAGNVELAVVESQEAANQSVALFKASLALAGGEIVSFDTEPMLLIVPKELDRGLAPVEVETAAEAAADISAACGGSFPLLTATVTEEVTKTKTIAYDTKVVKSDDYEVGYKKVTTKGQNGTTEVVKDVTRVNGELVSSQVTQETVVKEAVTKVIVKGTAEPEPEVQASTSTSSSYSTPSYSFPTSPIAGTTGADIVNYAMQFLGNPYVYGGTSLTNGTDCSGFTMSVYGHFGISLPHTSSSQRYYGTAVSYSNAQPGDLIYYSGHVAIYIGGGKIIHASTPIHDICIGSATYSTILGVRRLI